MKLEPPSTNLAPNAALQAEHNSMKSPKVRNDIGASPHLPLVTQFIRAELTLHLTKSLAEYRILDVGCGNAMLLRQLRDLLAGHQLFGCDIEAAHVKLARWFCGEKIKITHGDFSHGGLFTEPFDFVTAIGLVWYDWRNRHAAAEPRTTTADAQYPVRFAAALSQSLRPRGYFIHDWRKAAEQYDLEVFQSLLRAYDIVPVFVMCEPLIGIPWSDQLAANSSLWVYRKETP